MERGDLHAAGEHLTRGLEAVDLNEHQVLLERRCGPLTHAVLDEPQGVAVHAQEVVGDRQASSHGEKFPGLRPDVGGQTAFPVTHLGLLHLKLALGDAHTALLTAVEVEGDCQSDHEVVVRA